MKKWPFGEKLKKYLSTEIVVDYKACTYFFILLFYYSMYLIVHKVYVASLLHMAEIIASTYGMGYLQVLALGNFDESDRLGGRELAAALLCSALYTGISFWCGWFDRRFGATGFFALYCVAAYICVFFANKIKRDIDTEQLNMMLQAYKAGGEKNEQCHRDEKSDEKLR